MKMKIKGFFVIPLVAILVAMFTLGIVPGAATDTTADTTLSDTLTFVPPTTPATSSFDEELEGFISNNFGDDLQQAEGPLRGFSELMAGLLNSMRNILNSIVRIFQISGGLMGEGGFLGNIFPTQGLLG